VTEMMFTKQDSDDFLNNSSLERTAQITKFTYSSLTTS